MIGLDTKEIAGSAKESLMDKAQPKLYGSAGNSLVMKICKEDASVGKYKELFKFFSVNIFIATV